MLYDARGDVLRAGFDPRVAGAEAMWNYFGGSYTGARGDRRALSEWNPLASSPDADIIGDLPTLRARSRDLCRNAPLASGAVNTVETNAVGTGLRVQVRIDRELLGLSDEQADAWEKSAERIFRYQAEGRYLDVAGRDTFAQQQRKVLRGALESGDMIVMNRQKVRRGALVAHTLQLIEADRVCNPLGQPDRPGFAGGIETDSDGEPVFYHVASRHPHELGATAPIEWTKVPTRGAKSGAPVILHPAWRRRPDQSRGVPYLATVIEPLKQLDRYGEAELMAAVIGGMFTVFLKSTGMPLGEGISTGVDASGNQLPRNFKLGPGAILELAPNEDIEVANPGRPNEKFDPFVQAILRQIGVALEIPFEILIKHFTASYSAARAAQLEAWRFFSGVRVWLAADFCQPTYEAVITEAVARGLLDAPGFFADPLVRQAWLGSEWVGPSPGQIDPRAEVEAAQARIDGGFSTLEQETAALTGGSWERNHPQQVKERRARERDGLATPVVVPTAPAPAEIDARDRAEKEGETGAPPPKQDVRNAA
jgi:lambda family phage portal protein